MNIKQIVQRLEEKYFEYIKPNLEVGKSYEEALIDLGNMIMEHIVPYAEEIRRHRSGVGCIVNILVLQSALEDVVGGGEGNPGWAIKRFEAYLSQLSLSSETGNVHRL